MSQTQPNVPPDVPEPEVPQPPLPDWAKVPRMIALSTIAYKRDLPRLLSGGRRVGVSSRCDRGTARRFEPSYRLRVRVPWCERHRWRCLAFE